MSPISSTRFDTSAYLTPHSDIVAQLVQAHQTQMHNLITLTNYQTRIALYERGGENRASRRGRSGRVSDAARAQIERPAEELVRYLMFADEAPLAGPRSRARRVSRKNSRRAGRAIRRAGRCAISTCSTRLFKYPCQLPDLHRGVRRAAGAGEVVRLSPAARVLTGSDDSDEFWSFGTPDRRAVFEILLDTKPGLPEEWKTGASRPVTTTARIVNSTADSKRECPATEERHA